ncbi:Protein CBG25234 [Caenorhabditis briggsae]|uniref:Protein CBG25234 n=1 Tax=Caenorhabditis briggsae TaxID=6238 RepID=B6IFK4_CAEBR|nr:Protein CBG25234 [Caenorhabditis briggsae]CAR98684.1 Protein CBG25234 [Caenorhabditis briggsae]
MEVDNDTQPTVNIDETLTIQCDWHLALREPISLFWLGIKRSGAAKSEFFDVQVTKLVDEYGFAVMPGEGTIKSSAFTKILLDELRVLEGHIMDVYRCMYFPSGLVVLSGGMDMTVKIWGVDSGKCAATLKGHTQAVTGLGIIGVGREVLSCSNDGTARMWECRDSKTVKTWNFGKGRCADLSVSVDCSRFAVICESNFLSVIDLHGDQVRRDIKLPSEPSALCFSNDEAGEIVFVGFEDGSVGAYNVAQQHLIGQIKTQKSSVKCLKYFCNRLLVAFNDGGVFAYPIPSLPQKSGESTDESENIISAEYELTGADCDPIYDIAIHKRSVYTCCRDGVVRMYKLLWNT